MALYDMTYTLETRAVSGRISSDSALFWAGYFAKTGAVPILCAWRRHISNHAAAILLSASIVILAPLSADVTDVAANVALLTTSMVCYYLLSPHVSLPPSAQNIDREGWQEAGILQDGPEVQVALRQTGARMEAGAADHQREQRLPATTGSARTQRKSSHRRKGPGRLAPEPAHRARWGELTSTVGGRTPAKHSDSGLSAFGPFLAVALSSTGLWLAYDLSRDFGDGIAGDIFFCAYCLFVFAILHFPPAEFFPKHLRNNLIQDGGTLEDVMACNKARQRHIFYVVWGLLISTVGICVVRTAQAHLNGN
jgi:hypothetical protein